MKWLIALVLLISLSVLWVAYWRFKNKAFRAEVVIENLRIWCEMVEDYRRKNPEDRMSKEMSVGEEAVYMSKSSPLRKKVMTMAWDNVKKMTKYHVQECNSGKSVGGWQEIYANSDQEAAEKVVGRDIRRVGKLGELRVRVRPSSNPQKETDFYSSN